MAPNIDRYRDIVLGPCNRAADLRNTAAVRDTLEAVENFITNISSTIGDSVVPFLVKTSNPAGGNCEILIADRTTTPWSFTVDKVGYDYSSSGRFGKNMIAGRYGYGRLLPELSENAVEIIELEGLARFIDGTMNEAIGDTTAGQAEVTVANWYGAYPNSAPPSGTVIAVDRLGMMDNRGAGDKYLAIYDEQANEYVLIGPSEADDEGPGGGGPQDLSLYLKIEDAAKVIQIDGLANCQEISPDGNCLYSASIVSFGGTGPSGCTGIAASTGVTAIAVNACACKRDANGPLVRRGDRYVAVQLSANFNGGELWGFRIAEPSDMAVVEIYGPSGDDCDTPVSSSGNLYDGRYYVRDTSSNDFTTIPFDTSRTCKIWNITKCDNTTTLPKGERFVGHCVGTNGSEPVFAIEGPRNPELPRYGICVTNWHNTTPFTVDVKEVDSIGDPEPAGGSSINVILPDGSNGSPNLEEGNYITFQKMPDGTYSCTSDYMDDKIGTVKMFAESAGAKPQGWEFMNGAQGTTHSIDMRDRFPRGGDFANIGQTDGREKICEQELEHHHKLQMNTPDKILHVFSDDESGKHAPLVDKCFEPGNTFNDFVHTAEGFLEDEMGRKICVDPLADPNTVDNASFCEGDFGPINIMNPYARVVFIERVDNSG